MKNIDYTKIPEKHSKLLHSIFAKILDVVVSIVALIVFSPIILITVLAIVLDDKQSLIFVDYRLGKDRKPFKFYKFRSMKVNAFAMERKNKKLMKKLRSGKNKVENHPYVTKVGSIIRKYSIDEIPQLINVLKGDMGIIGPRAMYKDEINKAIEDYPDHKKYLDIVYEAKPGITGYWQVGGRNAVNFDKRLEMEAWYVRSRTILSDIIVILKTPLTMISGKTY